MHPVRAGLEGIDVVVERMLLQSVSDGQISHDGDAEFTKMVGRTYARAHEDGRAPERAGRQDDQIRTIFIAG